MKAFVECAGTILSRAQIERIYESDNEVEGSAVDMLISRVRERFG